MALSWQSDAEGHQPTFLAASSSDATILCWLTTFPMWLYFMLNCKSWMNPSIVVLDSASMAVVYPFHAFMHKPSNTAIILIQQNISQT
jgi:hypothetical protein